MTAAPDSAAATSGTSGTPDVPDVARLWVDTLEAIGRPLAHEVRNALNGVAVNVEVVRSRAARPGAAAADVARFADAAAEQLEQVAALGEGLLALVRPPAAAGELPPLAAAIGTVLRAIARPDGGDVHVQVADRVPPSSLDGATVRALLGALLVGAFDRRGTLSCDVAGTEAPLVRLTRADGALPAVPTSLREALDRAGVGLEAGPDGWTARFPARVG